MMKTGEEERLRWFRAFIPLYERAAPVVHQIANLDKLAVGELPVGSYTFVESNLTVLPILKAVGKLPTPEDKELASIQRESEIALSSCIKTAEAAAKYVELRERGMKDQVALSTIISSTVLAHEYIESVSKKLEILKPRMSNLEAKFKLGLVSSEIHLEEKKAPSENVTSPAGPQLAIDKTANGIKRGLDKLGDALVFPVEKMVRYAGRFKTANRKKGRRHHT